MFLRKLMGLAATMLTIALAGCGGGGGSSTPATFTIGGTVTGLATGAQVVLADNGADALTLSANGAFTFATAVASNGTYAVTVTTQPTGQVCSVGTGSGSGVTANVASVSVVCSTDTYTIGGTVSGLDAGETVSLLNAGANALTVSANGTYTFTTPVAYNGGYAVTVGTQPTGQTCSVSSGTGSGVTANVTNANVVCSNSTYALSGSVSGLGTGAQVTLANADNGDAVTVTGNGTFNFPTPLPFNGSYNVSVGTQPVGETCSVANGTGSGVTAAVSNVTVVCSTLTYTLSGTVSGLGAGDQVTLNNGTDAVTANANGTFSFPTPVPYNGTFGVTVGTQPVGQTCSVGNGTNSGVTANVSNITVVCATITYPIGGTVSGLATGQQVTLTNGSDTVTVTANGIYSFTLPVPYNGTYNVAVGTQPTGQTCSVANATGSGATAAVTANVTCATTTFALGGGVSGLTNSNQVTLTNSSDGELVTVTANGAYAFTVPVPYGGGYNVSVSTQPTGQTCSVSNGVGSSVTAAVNNLAVVCSTDNFTVSGTVTGLNTNEQVTLDNGNISNAVTVTANGAFQFVTQVPYGGSYAVTVGTQPLAQQCTVTGGTGSPVTGPVTGVAVNCTAATENIVYSFAGGPNDGYQPRGPLLLGADGNFYGTTYFGGPTQICTVGTTNCSAQGTTSYGVVFKLTPAGVETVLHAFANGTDGAYPAAGLTQDSSGNLYGTTQYGGPTNSGTVFKIDTNNTESVLYAFSPNTGGVSTDGVNPLGAVLIASDGNLYGTTIFGGTTGEGTVYQVTPAGVESVLVSFGTVASPGAYPTTALIEGRTAGSPNGILYGTTGNGGTYNQGVVYSWNITTPAYATMYSFAGGAGDGMNPAGELVQGADGNLYGTTLKGGVGYAATPGNPPVVTNYGYGVVYKVTPQGAETLLYSFTNGADGSAPKGALLQGIDGLLYGTTSAGGSGGYGTVYSIDTAPSSTPTTLLSFTGLTTGESPYAGLTLGPNGDLWGTTNLGSTIVPSVSDGVVFRLGL